MLLHERVDLLVRDEQQQAVDGFALRVEVAARRQLRHAVAHVAEELVAVAASLELGLGFEVAHVVVERELHVHVHHEAVRQQERVVGPAAGPPSVACRR